MRLRRLVAFAVALAASAVAPAPAAPPDDGVALVVAANDASGWRRVPDWMKRNLDPRRLGRATRDAFRDDEPAPKPKSTTRTTRKAAPKPRVAKAPEPEPVAPPPAAAPPAPPPPAPAKVEPAPAPIAPPPAPPRDGSLALLRAVAIAFSLGVLAATWRRKRRAAPTPAAAPAAALGAAPPLVALPRAIEDPDRTHVERPNATIDVTAETVVETAAETAILSADVAPAAFPDGGRYEILEEIGRGGMGVVYKARDKRLDRVVALKRLPDTLESNPQAVALLHREARSAARLNHRNIVTVHDVDREEGAWFITMELLEGELLSATLRAQGPLAPHVAAALGEQVAHGLGYAHAQGVVHRDVKPSNLFVTTDGTVKLMDFGVAKIAEEARRKRTLVGGTPSYMAPEQARGDAVDGRTDLYALGATLFELLTGQVPFAKGDPTYHHLATEPPDPRERTAAIPEAFAELVLALMRKKPEERPASAGEVARRLREIAAATLPRVSS